MIEPEKMESAKSNSTYTIGQHTSMDMSAAEVQNRMDFQLKVDDLTYQVGRKSKKIDILHNIDATFFSGELCAVMGPSGAGKSTLLSVISNTRSKQQIREGKVTLNNEELPKGYHRLCSYIPQNDVLYPGLTPRQSFTYSANLRLPSSTTSHEKELIVNKLLSDLHLEKCADTIIGGDSKRGISGGEKKRTSIGVELIVNPAIILVDEPTSGLDSKMAVDVVDMLYSIVRERNSLVLCTIHQPSWKIFQKFDKLTLLNHGRIVYHGEASNVVEYFNSIQIKVPEFENPMDHYFTELQNCSDDSYFSSKWRANITKREINNFTSTHFSSGTELVEKLSSNKNISMFSQFYILFRRSAEDTFRDKEKFVQGLVQKLAVGLLLGVIFFDQADGTNPSIFTSNAAIFFIIVSSVMDTTQKALVEYPLIKPLIIREYRNGAFDILPYFIAQLLNNTLFESFSSLFYMPAYFMIGLNSSPGAVLYFLTMLILLTFLGVELGLLIGAHAADIKEAQGYFIPLIMPQLIFGGLTILLACYVILSFFIPVDQIPVYFQWIYHASYFQYALSGVAINEFAQIDFKDCPPATIVQTNSNNTNEEPFPLPCFRDGEEYLESVQLKVSYLGRNMLITAGFLLAFIPIAYYSVRSAIKKGAQNV